MNIYQNAMESLVEQEVDRQLKALPSKVASYINRLELIAYALNQLPALYATSEQGLQHQIRRGKATHGAQVAQAVQRAIAAIRRDPLRSYEPLQAKQPPVLQDVLYQLRRVLKNERLNWETLPIAVEEALTTPPSRFASGGYRTASGETASTSMPTSASPSAGASSYAAHRLHVKPQRSFSPFPEPSGVFVQPTTPPSPPPPSPLPPPPSVPPRSAVRSSVQPASPPPPIHQPQGDSQRERYVNRPAGQQRPPQQPARRPDPKPGDAEPPSGWDSCFFR
ncbi:MAG: hypothetical protein OHK0037_38640 [Elainellaceae cyanobacterium]